MHQHRAESSRRYLITGLEHLIEAGLLTREDDIAYLGGSFGEGHGTSFLEINGVGKIIENYSSFELPNLEEANTCN